MLGYGEVLMDLPRQIIDAAKQKVNRQLKEYGIAFNIEEKTINVDSPTTIWNSLMDITVILRICSTLWNLQFFDEARN